MNSNQKTRNKTVIFLTLGLTLGFLLIPSVSSHAPSVDSYYDSDTGVLLVIITHLVDDNTTHYINRVEIYINNSLEESHSYPSQPTESVFFYDYSIVANNGTTIKVIAYCNEGGNNQAELTVGENDEPDEPVDENGGGNGNDNSIPLSGAPIIIFSLLSAIFIIRRIKKFS